MATQPTWIDHFPENFTWSNAMLVTKGMAPYGAVALEEIDRIAERLRLRPDDPDAWWQEWSAMAAKIEAFAGAAAAQGRQLTAGNYYIRAGNYYFTADRPVPPSERKLDLYRKALRCFHAGFERRYPRMERIDVAYENKALPAYFLPAQGVQGPAPTVVVFDGLDNCKEMSVLFAGLEFSRRGFNTLSIDGPGQGEALRLRGIHSRYDYEVAGTAAFDYIASRPDVDAARVAVMAYSFGGYYAPRIVAFEPRYAACVVLGTVAWDIHAKQLERKRLLDSDPKKTSQSPFQLPWVLGVKDMDAAIEAVKRFSLVDCASQIRCPLLITHGVNDRLAAPADAEKLRDAAGSKDKLVKLFTADEGGAEHCHVDNRQVGIDYVADWLTETLLGKTA
ncbi:MAG: alpha/beta hydrolase [Burkholderiales bacterium]|nr:alpha/beta hydrolase [Burkholderiales bacterium]